MTRGDIVTVAAAGDHGKPRPAVIVQMDAFSATHPSVVVCQMTSEPADSGEIRIAVTPGRSSGLRVASQIMVDKPVTVRRGRIGPIIGHLGAEEIRRLNTALGFVMSLAD